MSALSFEDGLFLAERPRIFRSVRAGIIYDKSEFSGVDLKYVIQLFKGINVELYSPEELSKIEEKDSFGILGVLGDRELVTSGSCIADFECLKIGFYSERQKSPSWIRRSLSHLDACVICRESKNAFEALTGVMYHFYGSLTMPSLLNIDLADVESIAGGIGFSFNQSGDDPDEIIRKLPEECFNARRALLHFTCEKNVTLEEVYEISKSVSAKARSGSVATLPSSYTPIPQPGDAKKLYKKINIKMGIRVLPEDKKNNGPRPRQEQARARISLTAILFGV